MSSVGRKTATQHDPEHGTVVSYIVGFLLSLLFTFIPYYMVVHQPITGSSLLITILVFAVLQLLVQVIFFLHIGRGPKPNWNLYYLIGTVITILIVVGGSIFIINNITYNMLPTEQAKKLINDEGINQIEGQETGACAGQYETHRIELKNNQVNPEYTYANKCDTLLFINEDSGSRTIVFGEYPKSKIYAGEIGIVVSNRRSDTLTLSEVGSYQFYDKNNPATQGFFVVESEVTPN